MSTPAVHPGATWAFIVGAAGTTVAGVLIQTLVIPTTDVADDRWSYPWEAGPFVAVSFVYIVLHLLGAVFGLGVLLSAVGFLILGVATLGANVWCDWRRYTPLVTGIWMSILHRETRTSNDQSLRPVV